MTNTMNHPYETDETNIKTGGDDIINPLYDKPPPPPSQKFSENISNLPPSPPSTSIQPPPPPSASDKHFGKFMFDNIVQGIGTHRQVVTPVSAPAEPAIGPQDIDLNFQQDNPMYTPQVLQSQSTSTPSTPSIPLEGLGNLLFDNILTSMKTSAASVSVPMNTIPPSEATPIPSTDLQMTPTSKSLEGLGSFLFDNILTAMKTSTASVSVPMSISPVEETIPPIESTPGVPSASSSNQLANFVFDNILSAMSPAGTIGKVSTDAPINSKKMSIYKLFLEDNEIINFKYGIGIIDAKLDDKFKPKPSRIRHYFSYKYKDKPSYIYSILMAEPSFNKNINNIFVSKLKTNKELQTTLSKKYRSLLDESEKSIVSVESPDLPDSPDLPNSLE